MTPTPAEIAAMDLARLPTRFRELAECIGLAPAVRLAIAYQSQRLYVPRDFPDEHEVVKLIGRRAADAFSFAYRGADLQCIPGASRIMAQVRAMRMQEARTEGQPVQKIASDFGVSARTVKSLTRAA